MEQLLTSEYRKTLWKNTEDILEKLHGSLQVSKVYALGSFLSDKTRPSDVDLIVFVKTPNNVTENWSVDVVFVPDNAHGEEILMDAEQWMQEKYGTQYTVIDLGGTP